MKHVLMIHIDTDDADAAARVQNEIAGAIGDLVERKRPSFAIWMDDLEQIESDRNNALIELARDRYASESDDDIEVYDNARTSTAGDNGEWVEAWVYIPRDVLEDAGLMPSAEQGVPEEAVESEGGHCD